MNEIFVKNARQISLLQITDGFDGKLSIAEEQNHIPFNIKRVYYIYNLINHEDIIRGKHAHKKTEQVMFCLNGSCNMLLDDGKAKQEICLDNPSIGVYIGANLWHTMYNFQNNCILLVFASNLFQESDYIRNYNDFLDYLNNSI